MNKSELIKELRALTQAGMKDCADALTEADNDIQRAVDIIKTKGKNIVSGREGKETTEGVIHILYWDENEVKHGIKSEPDGVVAVEVNCQTDFAARTPEFIEFAKYTAESIGLSHWCYGDSFDPADSTRNSAHECTERERQKLISKIKENVVIRRWWIEEVFDELTKVFTYTHSNNKLGSIVTIQAPNADNLKEFDEIGAEIAMQIAAMNPLAISKDVLPKDVLERQTKIFEEQLREANKPQAQWSRILEGKLNKWYGEVCLLNQESVVYPKKTIEKLIKEDYHQKLGGELKIVNFFRCQVGE